MTDQHEQDRRDDEDWLEVLAGRSPRNVDPSTRREAEILREALRLHNDRSSHRLSDQALGKGREKLLFRLRQEGLLKQPGNRWKQNVSLLSGLAALIMVAVLVPLMHQTELVTTQSPIIKGFKIPEVVHTDEPAAEAAAFAESLGELGLETQPIRQNESWFIEVQIHEPPPGLDALLQRHRLSIPSDSHLFIEFVRKEHNK